MNSLSAVLVLNVFVIVPVSIQAYNILALLPLPLRSHYIIYESILTELASRGHNVTVVNPFPKSQPINNFLDVDVSSCIKLPPSRMHMDKAETYRYHWHHIPMMMEHTERFESMFTCKPMTDFLASVSETTYNLVITEVFSGEVMLSFTRKFKASFISFCAGSIYPWIADRTGNPYNPSYISYTHTNYPIINNPTFYDRLANTIVYLFASALYYHKSYFTGDNIVPKYLGSTVPALTEIAKNTSLILTFSHFSLNLPMPLLPNIIEISGVHIKDSKPLPQVNIFMSSYSRLS